MHPQAHVERAWCDVLGVTNPQPDDNFFLVGGTSLKAAAFVRALTECGVTVPLVALFTDGRLSEVLAAATVPAGPSSAADSPKNGALALRLLASFERNGDRPAISCGDAVLTYAQLGSAVTRLLDRLNPLAGEPIGLFVGGDIATRVLYLAILLGGGVVVPLSRTWPAERTRHVINRIGAVRVVYAGESAAGFSGTPQGNDYSEWALPSAEPWPGSANAEPLAYVLHTSGSTGVPKGVPVTQSAVLSFIDYVTDRYGIGVDDRMSATFELSFDLAVYDLLVPLLSGASVHLPLGREYLVPEQYVTRARLTHWFSVPSVVSSAQSMGALRPGSLPGLRWSLFCGEPLMLRQAEAWRAAAPASVLENLYGPTELTLACAQYRLSEDPSAWPRTVNGSLPIGTVYPHLAWRVGSARDGAELLVRGNQCFDGYVDPADDEVAFEADADGHRWYRTGDRVSVEEDGLVHRGRLDRQVKVGGMRIELDEVEGAFRRALGVTEAAAVLLGEPGLRRIVMVLCGDENAAADTERTAREALPAYMYPAEIRYTGQFPLNANRKVDYQTLEAWVEASGPPA